MYTFGYDQVRVISMSIISITGCLFVVRKIKTFFSKYFEVYTLLLTVVTFLGNDCHNLFFLCHCNFVPIDHPHPIFNPPYFSQPLVTIVLLSMQIRFLDFTCKWAISVSVSGLFHLTWFLLGSSMLLQIKGLHSFLWLNDCVPLCMCTVISLSISWWTPQLIPYLCYCV